MVLGPMHLHTLKKLKEQGPTKTGLHVSVSNLVKTGFVNYVEEDGYSLSETGQIALIAYDEMDDLHREIMMRLNRSAVEKQRYSKYALKSVAEQDRFDDLLVWDLVDVDEHDNITLTDDGHKLWEIALKAHAFRDEQVAETIRQGQKKSTAKKREREVAPKPGAGKPIVPDVVAAVVTPPITEIPIAGDCPDCSNCIDAEVLKLIAAKYPKVAELRETLLKEKQILKELGL